MTGKLRVMLLLAMAATCLWAINLAAQGNQPGNTSGQRNMGSQSQGQGTNQMREGKTGKTSKHRHGMAGASMGSGKAQLQASLVDEQKRAQEGEATVKVRVSGVKLTDPDSANEQPKEGEAHIHYRLDDGPTVATTATKLEFHDLTPGEHSITVMLSGNNHEPLGAEQTLTVTIPEGAAARR